MTNKPTQGHRERLRQQFLKNPEDSLSDEFLIELLLTYAIPQKDVKLIALELLQKYGSLDQIFKASMHDLCQITGLKESSAILIKLVDWFKTVQGTKIESPESIAAINDQQLALFSDMETHTRYAKNPENMIQPNTENVGDLFSITALREAIILLPYIPDTADLESIKEFLRSRLHFNSERTRKDYAAYIVKRMFPFGYADHSMRLFAKHFPDTQDLKDVCFYRFAKSEPLTLSLMHDVVIPGTGSGKIDREDIKLYLFKHFGKENKNISNCITAFINILTTTELVRVVQKNIQVTFREIKVPALAFILHSEFSEPGMYSIEKAVNNRALSAMMWNPDQILAAFYELRNRGILSKVSEIDSVRQFTTKWNLEQVTNYLVSQRA